MARFKIYKTYFDKNDTPFRQDIQVNQKYHTVWFRLAYTSFFGHKTVKIKLFGLFTIHKLKETEDE